MNAIGTQLRGLINSRLVRWWLTVLIDNVAESSSKKRSPRVRGAQGSAWAWRMSGLTRNRTTEPISRDQLFSVDGEGKFIFPVQLTTSRIGKQAQLVPNMQNVLRTKKMHLQRKSLSAMFSAGWFSR